MSDVTETVEIAAPITRVWELLRNEAQFGIETGRVDLILEERPYALHVEVQMGLMFRVRHEYRLERSADRESCYITDEISPSGLRWIASNVFLFGKGIDAVTAAAHQGLQNLKVAAESGKTPADQIG